MKRFLCAFLVAATMTSIATSVNAEINNLNIGKSSIAKTVERNAVIQSELPVIEITTENGQDVTSKDYYLKGNVKITGNGEFDGYTYEGSMQIKGRGNSTWGMPKKPYRIKLDAKSDILGLGEEKDWVLLANYADKTLIRNKLAFNLAADFGLDYTSKCENVDVVLNGKYIGTYLLCEQVEVGENRVEINELKETDKEGEAITGGYLIEVDYRFDEDYYFTTELKQPMTFKSPSAPNNEQYNYITNYINELEKTLIAEDFTVNGKHYSDYIDVDSLIDYYLVNEIFKNYDAAFRTSVYMYKPRNEKIKMGPIWDFDIAAGNSTYKDFQVHLDNGSPEGWWMREEGWYGYLFKDPKFVEAVQNRFWELIDIIEKLPEKVDINAKELDSSQKMNDEVWQIIGKRLGPYVFVGKTYEEDVKFLKDWLTNRIDWMKKNMGDMPQEKPEENLFDINKDGTVNIGDLAILSKNFGKYDATMDINKDGKLNETDIKLLIDEILKG